MDKIYLYLILFVVSFVQNMAFTLVSRSRNSGDPNYHRYAAYGSNTVWFICNYFILFPEMSAIMQNGQVWERFVLLLIYVVATAEGSVYMMKIMLKGSKFSFINKIFKEENKRKVGER